VGLRLEATAPPTEDDKRAIKLAVAESLEVDAAQIHNFDVVLETSVPTPTSRRGRALLEAPSYSWRVAFDVVVSLADTAVSSAAAFATDVTSVLAAPAFSAGLTTHVISVSGVADVAAAAVTRHPTGAPSPLPSPPSLLPSALPVASTGSGSRTGAGAMVGAVVGGILAGALLLALVANGVHGRKHLTQSQRGIGRLCSQARPAFLRPNAPAPCTGDDATGQRLGSTEAADNIELRRLPSGAQSSAPLAPRLSELPPVAAAPIAASELELVVHGKEAE
jgi:hypothetical protein